MVPVQGPDYAAMLWALDRETRSWGIYWRGLASLERVLSGSGWWVHRIKESIAGTLTICLLKRTGLYSMTWMYLWKLSIYMVGIEGTGSVYILTYAYITSEVWVGWGIYVCRKGPGFDPHLPWLDFCSYNRHCIPYHWRRQQHSC